MITLALDTSTGLGSVALLRDDQTLGEQTFSRTDSTQHLFGALQNLLAAQHLALQKVDLLAVGIGPGSFTGIRVGIAAAMGLAMPRSLPIKPVSSFDALALTALPQMPGDCAQLCVLSDARRDEVYFARYDRAGQRTGSIRLGALETIASELHDPIWFVSSEIDKFRATLAELFGGFATACVQPIQPSAAVLGRLARQTTGDDSKLEPIYLREAQYTKL